jgi:hypothetical protein
MLAAQISDGQMTIITLPATIPVEGPCTVVKPPTDKPPCSFTALNRRSCNVIIDRLQPTNPPTIYAAHNTEITVYVGDLSSFETLYLDWKSTTTSLPPDAFATIFAGVSGLAGRITVLDNNQRFVSPLSPEISKKQKKLLDDIQALQQSHPISAAKPTLEKIKQVLQPVPGDVCWRPDINQPWVKPTDWKASVIENLTKTIPTAVELDPLKTRLSDLKDEIAALTGISAADLKTLNDNQDIATKALDYWKVLQDLLDTIREQVRERVDTTRVTQAIHDAQPKDKNYQTQVWTLEYTNKLASAAKRAAADSYKPPTALGDMIDVPTKVPIATITVQYQQPTRVEVSTGLMVPMKPYHSYAAAEVAANGSVTGNVVQETLTYTVVPVALVNIPAKDWSTPPQRTALFGTTAVGYNAASSAVEFGAGLSFSWRSIVISGLADIGRDTRLAGGFAVGQPLSATNPAKPLTTVVWGFKPAAALSVRIPLGGAGK